MIQDPNQPDQLPQDQDPRGTPVPDMKNLTPADAAALESFAKSSLSEAGIEVGEKTPEPPKPMREIDVAELERMARSSIREAGISLSGPAQMPGGKPGGDEGVPVPEARTWGQIQQQFAPGAKEPVEIRGWETLVGLLEDVKDRLENIETMLQERR